MKIKLSEEVEKVIRETITEEIIKSQLDEANMRDIIEKLKMYAAVGSLTIGMLMNIAQQFHIPDEAVKEIEADIAASKDSVKNKVTKDSKWVLVADNVIGTVYNAVPAQCKADCSTTANNFRLNLKNPGAHRIVAIERTMEKKWGVHQGDIIYVKGTDNLDGVWQVQDRMNKRFAGQPKIDFLVNNNRKTGKWNNLKIYKLRNPEDKDEFQKNFAPQLPKKKVAIKKRRK